MDINPFRRSLWNTDILPYPQSQRRKLLLLVTQKLQLLLPLVLGDLLAPFFLQVTHFFT